MVPFRWATHHTAMHHCIAHTQQQQLALVFRALSNQTCFLEQMPTRPLAIGAAVFRV
jgi:hypothetical protein